MNSGRATLWLAVVLGVAVHSASGDETYLGRSLDAWSEDVTSADGKKRARAAFAIARLAGKAERGPGDQVYFAELVKLTSDGDAVVRYWGAVGMEMYGGRGGIKDGGQTAVVNALLPLLEDSLPRPRIAAAQAVGLFGRAEKALPVLEAAMSDPQEAVRIQAVEALEKLGAAARPAQATLRRATSDSSTEVKRISRRALDRLEAEKK
jgi:HEAT repeat protein